MKTPRRSSALATPLILALACVALAACGSSSTTTTTSANVSGAAAGATGPGGAGSARFAAIRACLAKAGITLPRRPGPPRTPGTNGGGFFGGGGGGGGGGGAFGGANTAKVQAALRSCGLRAFGGGRRRSLADNPTAVAALTKFATCMRSNGINVPNPNTSGSGPVFNTNGLNTTSAAFRTAYAKCAPDLPAGFGRRGTTGPTDTAPGPSA